MSGKSARSFAHLHVHSEYSMLDGAARVDDLFAEAARMEMPAIAVTDHGNMFGAYEFYRASKGTGVKPIIGIEAYLTPHTSRFERRRVQWGNGGRDDVSGGGAYTHLTMLAETTEGMHNLFRMSSLASLEGYYFKARMDRDLLQRYARGVIATTGCPSSEVQTLLRLGKYDDALASAAEFRDIFGRDNYYVELMDHGLEIERRVRDELLRLARKLNLPLVATNDLHYTGREDAEGHAALLCVQSGSTLADPNRFRFDSEEFYLKSAQEMRELWSELPEACDNTLAIAERCQVAFAEDRNLMPRFPVPHDESEQTWFLKQVERGLARRYPRGVTEVVRARADRETGIILEMGFPGYFLVVADFITWAKEQGIRVGPGRGSATGSIVAYALGVTELDPLEHGLLFERFLNPERISMPDIDIDFDERRRGEVIRYCTQKYGDERVAQIVTYGTIKAKQAVKDSSRVLGFPFAMGERITKAMPPAVMGKDVPLTGIFDDSHKRYGEAGEFRSLYDADTDVRRIVDTAKKLENLKRQWGVHAAGVIMSSEPLIDVIPIMRREQDGAVITQFDYPTCETLGLLKMDFLGLRNLTVIDDALQNIAVNGGQVPDLDVLGLDDQPTYDLLARGETLGVFQLDGGPMRQLLRQLRPDCFEDIAAVLALYRPGPMGANSHTNYALRKNGKQEITAIHPELEEPLREILAPTYGLIIYQEQVMEIPQKLAGYSLGKADLLRRAMGKKKREVLDAEFESFRDGMLANGYSSNAVQTLWDILLPFSDYAFNKSHTAGYGMVSYWTAFLKANHPAEYMAALLTSVKDSKDKMAVYLNECRRMGIKVLPPDVNESAADFTP
ncbi:MAG: DNA polymerase III subunit alpha, partial [Nocardioidaceae bacterium]